MLWRAQIPARLSTRYKSPCVFCLLNLPAFPVDLLKFPKNILEKFDDLVSLFFVHVGDPFSGGVVMKTVKASGRERRIIALAQKINKLMRASVDRNAADASVARNEVVDAHEAARILFRLPKDEYTPDGR